MFDLTNKRLSVKNFSRDMLNKTLTMFTYNNLPDTLPQVELEKLLQVNGFAVIAKVNNEVYAFNAGFSGQDVYNNPTTAIVTNPALEYSGNLEIGSDCVLFKNNDLQKPISTFFEHYGTLINENEITMLLSDYNARVQTLISANDDGTIESAKEYLNNIVKGSLGIIGENKLFTSLKVQDGRGNSGVSFSDLFGYQQYLQATLNNEIGLATNNNMKKERLTTNEIDVNQKATYPLIDNMYRNRLEAIALINAMFSLNIEVEFNSIWSSDNSNRDNDTFEDNGGYLDETDNEQNETDNEQNETDSEYVETDDETDETDSNSDETNTEDEKEQVDDSDDSDEDPDEDPDEDEKKEDDKK